MAIRTFGVICALLFAIVAQGAFAPVAYAQVDSEPDPIIAILEQRQTEAEEARAAAAADEAGEERPTSADDTLKPIVGPQEYDYLSNEASEVFGARLFTGAFANQSSVQFNPDYAISIGDRIQVRLWGAYTFQSTLSVDPQGNIFLPNVGPINLQGVRNGDLQDVVRQAVRGTFRSNVSSYASLAAAQPVRVYVGGFVRRPGAYSGTSLDSVLHYLDQAGGIDPDRGSFISIEVKRGTTVRAEIDLYDFLLNGDMPQVQLADGDVIFVDAQMNTVEVDGLVDNANIFEFEGEGISLFEVATLARPKPEVTHVRVVRSTGVTREVEYFPILEASNVIVYDGNQVIFTADKRPGTITVRLEGEHEGQQEYVLPYGAQLGTLLELVEYTPRSAPENIQLFRESVAERQKALLEANLQALETAALTARSGTNEEASLRAKEAELLLQWVERARDIEPRGQVVIAQSANMGDLLLENGDIIRIPARDGLVLVSGEVTFPNTIAYDAGMDIGDYIAKAGGFTARADNTRVIVARQDGSFGRAKRGNSQVVDFGDRKSTLVPGDQIMVLPKVDTKNRQILKEMTQILYQIAVGAGVVLRF